MMGQVLQGKEVNLINPQGNVALYWDFENLHAGVFKQKSGEDDDYANICHKPQEALMDVAAVLAFAETVSTLPRTAARSLGRLGATLPGRGERQERCGHSAMSGRDGGYGALSAYPDHRDCCR